jgi:single-stranded-DNA-specific exonuclease
LDYIFFMKKEWKKFEPDPVVIEEIQKKLGCHRITATVMANRNIDSPEKVRQFFDLSLKNLRPPFDMCDMDAAVERIVESIENNERILIFGDYDVDGITATTLLIEFLEQTGADVSYYIPHRTEEGYDIQVSHIYSVALPGEIDLIITVDCGSTRHDAVKAAKENDIDVIITDHHTIMDPPPALAVVNPKRADCCTGLGNLAGVGVAFALIISLRKHLRDKGFWRGRSEPNLKNLCDLVALGTVADMVPLVDDNRILSKAGLEVINSGRRPGISALLKASKVESGQAEGDDIAFRLAPRLNAAGRLGHAKTAVELLRTQDSQNADTIAENLNDLNAKRQQTEKSIFNYILEYIKRRPDLIDQKAWILFHSDWHEGVLGIVASKLVEQFIRPVILLSSRSSIAKGSGRSIPGIDLHSLLYACRHHLEKFGGHPMAAGLQIQTDRIEAFRKDFLSEIGRISRSEHFCKTLPIDCSVRFDQIRPELLDELEQLGPFGEGNPEPLFMSEEILISSYRFVGGSHLRLTLRQVGAKNGLAVNAMRFNTKRKKVPEGFDRIAFRLRWNRWNGRKTPQMIIEEIS